METAVECTHCKVVMTSWTPAGSPIRYFQCPFCQRMHSSYYGEVFRRRAGARVVRAAANDPEGGPPSSSQIPMASPDDVRWAHVKASAASWFARLDAEQTPGSVPAPRTTRVPAAARASTAARGPTVVAAARRLR